MTALSKRLTTRFHVEDDKWLAEQAAEEGVDKATMLRLIVNRMRRGIPPLVVRAMLEGEAHVPSRSVAPRAPAPRTPSTYSRMTQQPDPDPDGPDAGTELPADQVDALLDQRLAEIEPAGEPEGYPGSNGQGYHEPASGAPAVSLRTVPRATYNPGRSGRG